MPGKHVLIAFISNRCMTLFNWWFARAHITEVTLMIKKIHILSPLGKLFNSYAKMKYSEKISNATILALKSMIQDIRLVIQG